MTALSEALVAAQRRAIAALEKAYVAQMVDRSMLDQQLNAIGCTDSVDQEHLYAALDIIQTWGASLPQASRHGNGNSPDAPPALASDKQKAFIVKLLNEGNFPVIASQDLNAMSKQRAHEIIEALQANSYDPSVYDVPF